MAHFVGKINLAGLLGVRVADVWNEDSTEQEKCLVIPIRRNGIQKWNEEWQLWFRAFGYHEPKGSFSHFIMKFIPLKDIKKMSWGQIEAFANHSIGGILKTKFERENEDLKKEQDAQPTDTKSFIENNL